MQKRGLSGIISVVLLILIVIVAIGIVWVSVSPIFTSTFGKDNGEFNKFVVCLDLDIQLIDCGNSSEGVYNIRVKRGIGGGNLSEIKFLFKTDNGEFIFSNENATPNNILGELSSIIYSFNLTYLIGERVVVQSVDVAGILDGGSGCSPSGSAISCGRGAGTQEDKGDDLVANFTISPNPANEGKDVVFDASLSTGNITNYFWDFENDGIVDLSGDLDKIVTKSFSSGSYEVNLTVEDDNGLNVSIVNPLIVEANINYVSECNDGIDNDLDELVDMADDGGTNGTSLGCFGPNGQETNRDYGWTLMNLSSDSKIVYVSNSDGDNSCNGLGSEPYDSVNNPTNCPKANVMNGYDLLRDGYGDWLLLKRGDVWNGDTIMKTSGGWADKSGLSAKYPLLISSYGNDAQRPILKNYSLGMFRARNSAKNISYVAIKGIEVYNSRGDPNASEFDGSKNLFIERLSLGNYFLIEDVRARFAGSSISLGVVSNLVIRRSVIEGAYSASSSHSQGLFLSNANGVLIEENIFDHNGWNGDFDLLIRPVELNPIQWATITDGQFRIWINGSYYDIDGLDFSGVQTMDDVGKVIENSLNSLGLSGTIGITWHNSVFKVVGDFGTNPKVIDVDDLSTYSGNSFGTDISTSIWLDRINAHSPTATQFNHDIYIASETKNVTARENILSRPSASGLQARSGGILEDNFIFEAVENHVGRTSTIPVPGGVNGTWRNNVVLGATFTSGSDSRGGKGLEISHANDFSAEGNIITNSVVKSAGIILGGSHEGIKNVSIKNNIVYKAGIGLSTCCYEKNYNWSDKTVKTYNNIFQRYFGIAILQMKHRTDDYSSHFDFQNNTWWSAGNQNGWFDIEGFDTEMSFSEWVAHVGEIGSEAKEVNFVDPDRNLSTYMAYLGEQGSSEAFLDRAKEQSIFNWNVNYTSYEVNQYIRDGFEVI